MTAAAVFAAVSSAYAAGHWVGDYWVQTNAQAIAKGRPGWAGRRACVAHLATYTLTLAACLALARWRLALPLNPLWVLAGLGLSAVTRYAADRRRLLERLAGLLPGKLAFYRFGDGLASGAAHLDQAWHWGWLFAAALLTAGGSHA